MASAHVRKVRGSYCVVIDRRDDGGGRMVDSRHRTESAASKACQRAEDALANGAYSDPRLTVGEVVNLWLDSPEVAKLRPGTVRIYRQVARDYLLPGLGSVRVRGLTGDMVDSWISENAERRGLAPATQYQHYAALHRALAWAVKKGRIGHNPADRANTPKITRHEMRFLEMDEARVMLTKLATTYGGDPEKQATGVRLTAAGHSVLYLPVLIALATGMRRSEILRLTWADVRRDTGKVTVHESKTAAGKRTVTLPGWALEPLKAARKRQAVALLELGIRLRDDHPVCPGWDMGARGAALNPESLSALFRRWADRHGYKGLRFHDLRHTHVGWLIAKNVHAKVIQERLGHKSFSFTMDRYGHLIAGLEAQAAETLDDITVTASAAVD